MIITKLPLPDREKLINETAGKMAISPQIIEKDYWVVWLLDIIYNLKDIPGIVFRGGTSLSKVYNAIKRFSEDIDLSVNQKDFKNINFFDLKKLPSGARERKLRKIRKDFRDYIKNKFVKILKTEVGKGFQDNENWDIKYSKDERISIITFDYPKSLRTVYQKDSYVAHSVKIEIDIQPSYTPNDIYTIDSYISENYPNIIEKEGVSVRTLAIERTFWEKISLIHGYFNRNKITDRLSRHLYDIYMLAKNQSIKNEINKGIFLNDVIKYRNTFYWQPAAEYNKILLGKLLIVPTDTEIGLVKEDYKKMDEMFYGESPTFSELILSLSKLQDTINTKSKNYQ